MKKKYEVSIELASFNLVVTAETSSEAKKKALEKLSKKNILSLVDWGYRDFRKVKKIEAEEL